MAWAIGNPQQNAALHELVEHQHSDRVVAIIGGAILEDSLRQNMEGRFRSVAGHAHDMNEKLFRVGGPLGFLMPKIDLGYQLYMYEKPIRNAMYGIAEIRNLSAHQLDISFASDNPKMLDALRKMTLHEGRKYYPNPFTWEDYLETPLDALNSNRDSFFINLKMCLLWLMGDRNRHLPWSNAPWLGT